MVGADNRGATMSYEFFLPLAIIVLLMVLWVIWRFVAPSNDDRSFLEVMLDGRDSGPDKYRIISIGLIAVAMVVGYFVVE